MGGKITINLK